MFKVAAANLSRSWHLYYDPTCGSATFLFHVLANRPVTDWAHIFASRLRENIPTNVARAATLARMAKTVRRTTESSNGQLTGHIRKNKELLIPEKKLEAYIAFLIDQRNGRCALTGLRLQYDGACTDPDMLCSLDRIDSNRYYEYGNLQVVCRFANRWKSSSCDLRFRNLLASVRRQPFES